MINLVNPRSSFLTDELVMPPLGLMYLSSVLKKANIKHKFLDLSNNDMLEDGHLFSTGTTPQLESMSKLTGGYSVVGGPHASISTDGISDFSLIVRGEGEEVIEHIVKNKPRGIINTKRIKNLDLLPFPNRDMCESYHYEIGGKKATTMITSRGCNGKCSFCCKAVMNKGIFFRSPQNIIDELVVIKYYGYEAVMFYDDSMAINRNRLIDICKGIKRLNLIWRCFMRSDQVDSEIVKIMHDAGCYEVLLGIESGSNKILKNIRKNETAEQHKKAIKLLKNSGIRVKALMIVGLPGESPETIEISRQFVLETKPDELDVTILSVYDGCDIQKNPSRYELSFSKPTFYKGRNNEYISTVSTPYLSASEIVEARDIIYNANN